MQSFLNQLALHCIQKHGNQLGELSIILPNRRAIVFLKEEFKKELKTASWLPQFFSLEDFIQQLGDYTILDGTDLMFQLYKVHKQLEGKDAEPLQEFLGWGNTLLQDFNEIDRYLVDSKELFGFLTEAKALEIWNVNSNELTEFQHKYLKFWNKLYEYYEALKKELIKEQNAYQGLGFRSVAENLAAGQEPKKSFKKLVFAGFNAFTEAEKSIVNHFVETEMAEVIWDADEYYLNDKFQEAGNFLRAHKKATKGSFNWTSRNLLDDPKKITIHGVMGNVGQAKFIGNLIDAQKELATAVVLSDEGMLIPVLEALPEGITATNVTMGYPISQSPVFSWLESYLNLFLKPTAEKKEHEFYYKDVCLFLEHNLQQHLSKEIKEKIVHFLEDLYREKQIFIGATKCREMETVLGIQLFEKKNLSPKHLTESVLQLIQLIRQTGKNSLGALNIECLAELEKSFNRLQSLCDKEKELTDNQSLIEIFKQIVSQQTVSFVGEPLGGLQLMGVLESRTLDFENIIISSVNEGILPSGKSQNSFIPFDIKRKFNLPSYQEKDAIFAYHFYRLLQRAKRVYILYNSKIDQLEGGERSRFIEQILHEFKTKNPASTVEELNISPKPETRNIEPVNIIPTEDIQTKMRYKLEHRLSASALNTFLACPLDFYYKYVLKMREEVVLQEKVQDNVLGNLVHESLKFLYLPLVRKELIKEDIQQLKKKLDDTLNQEFSKQLNTEAKTGNHKLTFEVAKKFIENQLNYDLSQIKQGHKIVITELEEDHECSFNLKINDTKSIDFNLFGKIDRIDTLNGKVRIIDYKTGGTDPKDVANKTLNALLDNKSSKSVQLMLYKYMYWKNTGKEVDSGIISLRNISNGYMPQQNIKWQEDFEDILKVVAHKTTVEEPNIQHNSNSKYCTFCA